MAANTIIVYVQYARLNFLLFFCVCHNNNVEEMYRLVFIVQIAKTEVCGLDEVQSCENHVQQRLTGQIILEMDIEHIKNG